MNKTAPRSPDIGTSPIRVLHLITDSGTGGAEKILFELATRLDPARFSSRVIVLKNPGATAEKLRAAGIPVTSLGLPPSFGPAAAAKLPLILWRLVRELKKDPPRILHCWLFQANFLGRLAARAAGVKIVLSSLRVVEEERLIQYPLDRLTRGLVTRYLAVSTEVARHYAERLGLAADRITAIPNGIDISPFENTGGEGLRRELGISPEAKVLGTLGRLNRQKGLDVLLRALPEVRAQVPGLQVLIAGEGPERGELERRAGAMHGGIRFLGPWERTPEFMAALDLLALPSRWEGMPNVVLEAMAAARAVVASAVGGVPELVVSGVADQKTAGETGILVPPEDPHRLAKAVIALLSDEPRRRAMGSAGRARAAAEFSLSRMIERYAELYEDLLRMY